MKSIPLSLQQRHELSIQGFLVVPNVMDSDAVNHARHLFYQWLPEEYNLQTPIHQRLTSHHAGHSAFAWFCRSTPKIVKIFKQLTKSSEIVSSFQGCGYNPRLTRESCFIKTDQDPARPEKFYQGFLSITDNQESTFEFLMRSHQSENEFFLGGGLFHDGFDKTEPLFVPNEYLHQVSRRLVKVSLNAGDLVIWDSKILYQETFGPELRIGQYLCYAGKHLMSESESEKREEAYCAFRTSSFRPFPLKLERRRHRVQKSVVHGLLDQSDTTKEILDLVC